VPPVAPRNAPRRASPPAASEDEPEPERSYGPEKESMTRKVGRKAVGLLGNTVKYAAHKSWSGLKNLLGFMGNEIKDTSKAVRENYPFVKDYLARTMKYFDKSLYPTILKTAELKIHNQFKRIQRLFRDDSEDYTSWVTIDDLDRIDKKGCVGTMDDKLVCEYPLTDFQKLVALEYNLGKYNPKVLTDECNAPSGPKSGKRSKAVLNPTQRFLSEYCTPDMQLNGLLLWHSTGAGKTCSAVGIASNFEEEGYIVIYVCPSDLIDAIQKNVWDSVICHTKNLESVRDKKDPEEYHLDRINSKYSEQWLTGPVGYASFSNIVNYLAGRPGKSLEALRAAYRRIDNTPEAMARRKKDPFYKTCLILDEAQKLYSGELNPNESADMNIVEQMLQRSYGMRKEDPTYPSAKVFLMTATPMSKSPFELFKLLNLLKDEDHQLPTNKKDFIDEGFMTKDYEVDAPRLMKEFQGYISFLDMSKNRGRFAAIVRHDIRVPMSEPLSSETAETKQEALERLEQNFREMCREKKVNAKDCKNNLKVLPEVQRLKAELKKMKQKKKAADSTQFTNLMVCADKLPKRKQQVVATTKKEHQHIDPYQELYSKAPIPQTYFRNT
jgi:hypothetical protein